MHLQRMCIQKMSVLYHKTVFSQTSQQLFMSQCNEHIEMNKYFCNFSCILMAIIDSQFCILYFCQLGFRCFIGMKC